MDRNEDPSIKDTEQKDNFTEETPITDTSKRAGKRMWIVAMIADFLGTIACSLLGPFYPQEAERKGMSISLIGFVFSVFELVAFISSPLIGNYLSKLGPKRVLLCASTFGGISNISFGLLDYVSGTPFVILSFVLRCTAALCCTGLTITASAIIAQHFPENVSTIMASLETSACVGMMVGPVIGGALYELGGFGLPFYVYGLLIILNGSVMYVIFPTHGDFQKKKDVTMCSMLKNSLVCMSLVILIIGGFASSFVNPTLSGYMQPFGFSPAIIGLFFALFSAVYIAMAPVLGYLTDKKGIHTQLIVLGQFVTALGFLLLGSNALLSFMPFDLWSVIVGLVLLGCANGCAFVPPIKCLITATEEMGCEKNIATLSTTTGLIHCAYCLGSFLGPFCGSILVDEIGYNLAYSVFGMFHIFMTIVCFVYFLNRYFKKRQSYQTFPNLPTDNNEPPFEDVT